MGSLEAWTEELDDGFTRRVVPRKSGTTAGYLDIYVFTPDGARLR